MKPGQEVERREAGEMYEALNAVVKSLDFYLVSKGKPLKVSGMFRSTF